MSHPVRCRYWIFFLLISHSVAAQIPDFKFRHLGVKDGFSTNELGSIFRDSRGFLWATSLNGLNRFDGHHVTIYRHDPNDPKSIAVNSANMVTEDSLMDVWIGCGNGFVSRYNFSTNSFTNFDLKSSTDTIAFNNNQSCNIYCCNNNIWALRNLELYHFSYASQKFVHYKISDSDNRVEPAQNLAVRISPDQKFYFRLRGELMVMNGDGSNLHHYFRDTSASRFFNSFIIGGIYPDASGNLWFSEWNHSHTYFFSSDKNSFLDLNPRVAPLASEVVNAFIPYGPHQLLAASFADGIWLIDAEKKLITKYYRYKSRDESSLSGGGIGCLFLDKQGTLWATSALLDFCNPVNHQFRFIGKDPKPSSIFQTSPFNDPQEDLNHHLWFGEFGGGVSEFFPDSSHMIRYPFPGESPKSKNNNAIYSMFVHDRDHLWVGLQNGISSFDLQSKTLSDTMPFPGEGKIVAHHSTVQMLRDKNGLIWLATARNGIVIYDEKKKTCTRLYHDSPDAQRKLPGDWISQMAVDTKGNIWIAAKDYYGLTEVNPDSMVFHSYPFPANLFQKASMGLLYCMVADGDSVIWLGTWGYGLLKYDVRTRQVTIYDEKKGLSNNVVSCITTDHHGNLWMGTSNGLSNFDKKKKTFRNYFTAQGLPQDGFSNFIFRSSNGNIYLGVENGIVEFNPDSLLSIQPPPQTYITSMEVNGQPQTFGDGTEVLRFSPAQRNVAFEFSTINFLDPEHDQYSYRLLGYDDDWNMSRNRQYAAYTNLAGGDYTFEVRAANVDGIWNDMPARIFLYIATPFYQRWWFYLLIVFGISGILYLLYRIRIGRLLAIERMRTHISRDLHDDVGSALSSINIWSEVASHELKQDSSKSQEYLKRIHNSSQNMLDNMNDIIWAINPINDTVQKLLSRMKGYASEMLEPKNIHFEFQVSDAIKKVTIPMQYRREWYLIFKEAINNAAKYSEAKKISVRISFYHKILILQIKDDGKGFNVEEKSSGNGLRNMRERAEHMNAEFEVSSSQENGTEIILKQKIT